MQIIWVIIVGIIILMLIGVPFWVSLLIIGVLSIIIALIGQSSQKPQSEDQPQSPSHNYHASELKKTLPALKQCDSVIDVTEEYRKIDYTDNPGQQTQQSNGIPYWEKEYIYSTHSLNNARTDVRNYYTKFKNAFLAGNYYDLKDNSNYFFTLMFDFLEEYDGKPDLTLLTRRLQVLADNYPETKPYVERNLIERAKKSGRKRTVCAQGETSIEDVIELFPDASEWTFADKYAQKLKLRRQECELFNYFDSQWGSMYSPIEFMKVKHVQFYRNVIKTVKETYQAEGKYFEETVERTAGSFSVKDRNGHWDYNRSVYVYGDLSTAEKIKMVHNCIFRHCRNKLYEKYELHWTIEIFLQEHDKKSTGTITKLINEIEPIIEAVVDAMPVFTDEEEVVINTYYGTRWRPKFQTITENYNGIIEDFIHKVEHLAKQNEQNYGVGYLLFDASKFLVGKDDIAALKMYLRYVEAFRKFSKEPEKPLPKYICKKLFKKSEQQAEFEAIVEQYKIDEDQKSASVAINQLFLPKRKKLNLNSEEITKISESHSETVQLLNDVLSEEDVMVHTQEPLQVVLEGNGEANNSVLPTNILLDSSHMELLDIFVHNNYSLTKSQVADFAKSKGLMANRLIEKINELCYDTLDDVLIEEDGDNWTISEEYVKNIR